MTLVRWDPFREMKSLGRVFFDAPASRSSWLPAVDVFETEDNLTIRAELPGVKTEDIKVEVEDGILTIEGERSREEKLEEKDAYRLERVYGRFTRRFSLPKTVDGSKVAATYKDGILELVLPKAEESKPRKVEIKAA